MLNTEVLDDNFFVNKVPVKLLIGLESSDEPKYVSELRSSVDTTYAHLVKTVTNLEDIGLVKSKKDGRKKYVEITSKGSEYAEVFREFVELESKSLGSDSSIKGK